MRMTWPSHLRRLRFSMDSRETQPVLFSTSVCGTFSLQVMPRIFRRVLMKFFKVPYLLPVQGPGLATVKQRGYDYRVVDSNFGV